MPHAILVVDDEPAILDALAAALEDEEYAVRSASNGQAALTMQSSAPADLIVSDVMMPHLDGHSLVRALRARGDRTPVILMSALPIRAGAHDAVHRLHKPFDLDDFLDLVAAVLDRG
jgi:two-component system response regulator MprA